MTSQILDRFQPYSIYELADWTVNELKQASDELESSSPELILRWGFENFTPDIVLATGFGPEGIVLMHMASEIRPEAKVFYLDTDLLFPETYFLTALQQGRYTMLIHTAQCGSHVPIFDAIFVQDSIIRGEQI